MNELNNTQIDDAKDIDIVKAMYNLIEYRDDYSKSSGSFWQYYTDEPFLDATLVVLLIFLLMIITVLSLNLKQKYQARQKRMVQKMLKLWYHLNI